METKPIESITKQVIKDCLISKIIPAIMSKWPEGAKVPKELALDCIAYLEAQGYNDGVGRIVQDLGLEPTL
ncbi:hypothetical protein AAHA92_05949 [Salvia divinorum]|uniref:Uncharacterized protein n=1 Tax=Salvia divinorum TaxID=28513 RepID=A0ABD1I4X8_SALDI